MKFFIIATFSGLVAYFAPLQFSLISIGIAIFWRSGSDFWVVYKSRKSRGTKCKRYNLIGWKTFGRMILYQVAIISFYPIDVELLTFFGSENHIITRGLAVIMIAYELFMLNANVKSVTGRGIVARLKDVVDKAKEFKDLKNDLLK